MRSCALRLYVCVRLVCTCVNNYAMQSDNACSGAGAVYLFEDNGSGWDQKAYVKASNTGTNDYFGYAVALYGSRVAVGAEGEDSCGVGVGGRGSVDGLVCVTVVRCVRGGGEDCL